MEDLGLEMTSRRAHHAPERLTLNREILKPEAKTHKSQRNAKKAVEPTIAASAEVGAVSVLASS